MIYNAVSRNETQLSAILLLHKLKYRRDEKIRLEIDRPGCSIHEKKITLATKKRLESMISSCAHPSIVFLARIKCEITFASRKMKWAVTATDWGSTHPAHTNIQCLQRNDVWTINSHIICTSRIPWEEFLICPFTFLARNPREMSWPA